MDRFQLLLLAIIFVVERIAFLETSKYGKTTFARDFPEISHRNCGCVNHMRAHGHKITKNVSVVILCHRRYLKRRLRYSFGHPGSYNPNVITNKEAHMVHENMNKETGSSNATTTGKKTKISHFLKKLDQPKVAGIQVRVFQNLLFTLFLVW